MRYASRAKIGCECSIFSPIIGVECDDFLFEVVFDKGFETNKDVMNIRFSF